jgi:PIN domain nuclease of toxin-antitoxin system
MAAYVDTHVAVRLVNGDLQQLTTRALDTMGANQLLISPMAVLELEYMFELGRITIPSSDVVGKLQYELDLRVCTLDFQSIIQAGIAEKWTRDPFDRIIVAHAKANGFSPLISADREILKHYPKAVW